MRFSRNAILAVLLATSSVAAMPAFASPIYSWSGTILGATAQGQVDFEVINGSLQITLVNTSPLAPVATSQVLTGLLFDISGVGSPLGMSAASAIDGIVNAGLPPIPASLGLNICAPGVGGTALANNCGTTQAGGWEAGYWAGGAVPGTFSQQFGIGTSGLTGLFSGNPAAAGDANYGLVPAAGATSLDGLIGMQPYSYKSAWFTLYGAADLPETLAILNVQPLYGTAYTDILPPTGNVPPAQVVPAPGALSLLGVGCLALAFSNRKRLGGLTRKGHAD